MRDFINILKELDIYSPRMHNMSDNSFDIGQSRIEFFGADQADKLRGARRDYLFINECNNVDEEVFNQLEVRTSKQIFLDFNPTHQFWAHDNLIGRENVEFVKSSYKDNPFLQDSIIKSIEAKRKNEWWWTVYGLGEIGILEGAIFKKWSEGDFNDTLPVAYGLDFGWNPDPTALCKVAIDEKVKKIYVKELCYSNNLSQEQIAEVLRATTKPNEMIIADSADKRIIDSMYEKNFNIFAAEKGAGSVRDGIMFIQDYEIIVSPDSYNLKKELLNYCWNNKRAGIPIDKYNHLIDSMRYGLEKLRVPSFYFG